MKIQLPEPEDFGPLFVFLVLSIGGIILLSLAFDWKPVIGALCLFLAYKLLPRR